MLAKQKLAVYLKKSVRWDNMSVKKIKHFASPKSSPKEKTF
jgi:hypothetical protein